jgi:hypothetical protein
VDGIRADVAEAAGHVYPGAVGGDVVDGCRRNRPRRVERIGCGEAHAINAFGHGHAADLVERPGDVEVRAIDRDGADERLEAPDLHVVGPR